MKKIVSVLAVSAILFSCKNEPSEKQDMAPLADPVNVRGDTGVAKMPEPVREVVVKPETVYVAKTPVEPPVKGKKVVTKSTPAKVSEPVVKTVEEKPVVEQPAPVVTQAEPEKKGWSKAAKGTAIGGAAGAATGAIIGKNVKGAVIGTAVGAAGGYILGRRQDKKDGRVKKDTTQ